MEYLTVDKLLLIYFVIVEYPYLPIIVKHGETTEAVMERAQEKLSIYQNVLNLMGGYNKPSNRYHYNVEYICKQVNWYLR